MSDGWHLKVDLAELRRAVDRVLEHIEDVSGGTVSISADYFWSVAEPDLYDPTSSPELTIGQLSESWNNLKRERDREGDTIAFAAVWLGDVLKAIGHHTSG